VDPRDLSAGAERPEPPPGVRSLRRGLDVLQAIADAGGEVSLRELARRLRLAESTVHGLLRTLVISGHVHRTPDRRYALGPALIRLGEASNRKLGTQATPALRRLAELTGENADIAVLEGADAVYIAQAVVPGSTRSAREVERRLPAWSTAAGRVLLSQLTRSELGLFARHHLPADGPGPEPFLADLAHVHGEGWASENDLVESGVSCLAVPVPGGPIPLALTATGPSQRLTPERMLTLLPRLRQVAGELGAGLWRSPSA
jgi:IclR family acetate operon transcriptional repressor